MTRSRHDSLIVLAKRSAYALRLGDRGDKRSVSTPAAAQRVSKRVGEAWIAIMQEEAFPAQASITSIGELATALDHLLRCALP